MFLRSRVDSKTLTRNTRIIAEALTRVIYNLTEKVSHLVLTLRGAHSPPNSVCVVHTALLGCLTPCSLPLQGTPPDMPVFTEQMVQCGHGVGPRGPLL